MIRAHSSLRPQDLPTRHPQIGQCKQRHQLRRVLGQPFVAHLGETELALDHSKRVFHLGAHAGLLRHDHHPRRGALCRAR